MGCIQRCYPRAQRRDKSETAGAKGRSKSLFPIACSLPAAFMTCCSCKHGDGQLLLLPGRLLSGLRRKKHHQECNSTGKASSLNPKFRVDDRGYQGWILCVCVGGGMGVFTSIWEGFSVISLHYIPLTAPRLTSASAEAAADRSARPSQGGSAAGPC